MEQRQEKMLARINTMLRDGKLLSSVLFDTSEVMTILYEGHIWFARLMDGEAYTLVDLQDDSHIKPMVDYTDGKQRRQLDKVKSGA